MGSRLQVARYWSLVAGSWALVPGPWSLYLEVWLQCRLDTGYSVLDSR
jgi:hypothetical protein